MDDSSIANIETSKAQLEIKLKNASWTAKKQIIKDFEKDFSKKKAAKNAEPKEVIKSEYRQGNLSSFAANDLMRLYEVMDEAESISQLKIKNLQRITLLNENLDLKKRDGPINKRDFESYERKKQDKRFSW